MALPFSLSGEEDDESVATLAIAATSEVKNSIRNIHALVGVEGSLVTRVMKRLSDILNSNLWHATSNIRDKQAVLREARAHLEFFEARMEDLQSTDDRYQKYFLLRCGVIDFMSLLGGANSPWNEKREALEKLNRDLDLILSNPVFGELPSVVSGQNFVVDTAGVLFTINYLWKMLRVSTSRRNIGRFKPSLPSWAAFYTLEGPQRPPLHPEDVDAIGNRALQPRYADSENLRFIYDAGMAYERFFSGEVREMSRGELHCGICMEDIDRRDVARLYPCVHGFHLNCIQRWLVNHSDCPICRVRPAIVV